MGQIADNLVCLVAMVCAAAVAITFIVVAGRNGRDK